MTTIIYCISSSGINPVKEFINSLALRQKRKIFRLFLAINTYGLASIQPHVKKVINTPFFELRILGDDNIRIFFVITSSHSIMLLHGYIKKSPKIPLKELQKIHKTYNDYQNVS